VNIHTPFRKEAGGMIGAVLGGMIGEVLPPERQYCLVWGMIGTDCLWWRNDWGMIGAAATFR
jgi:hypothetical protein